MSTLVAQTISNGTVSTSSANVIQGSAKAWVNFDGGNGNTAGTIVSFYNVSSITANGTGNYTVTFTTAFANTNYAPVAYGLRDASTTTTTQVNFISGSSKTTGNFRVFTCGTAGTALNLASVNVAVFA
jgi:hypothetical protein